MKTRKFPHAKSDTMKLVYPFIAVLFFTILSFPPLLTTGNCEVSSPTVAVLPFENLNRDSTYEVLSRGMCESLIAGLSSVQSLILVERSQVEKILKEQALGLTGVVDEKTAPKTGQLLGAKYVVMGSYQIIGGKVRIITRFVDVETGQIDQSKVVSVTGVYPKEVFDLQDQIASKLVASFNVAATKNETDQMAAVLKSTKDFTAYELYIKGRNAYLLSTEQGYQDAISLFKKAIEKDPNYALAYAGLSEAYTAWGNYKRMLGEYDSDPYKEGSIYAMKAIKLSYYLGAAQRSVALSLISMGDTTNTPKECAQEAVKLSPHDAESWFTLWLTTDRDPDHPYLKKALNLNPNIVGFHTERARQYLIRDKKNEGAAELNEAIRLSPNNVYSHSLKATLNSVLGNDSIAFLEATKAYELEPRDLISLGVLAQLNEKWGNHLVAKQQAEDILKKNPYDWEAHLTLGLVYYSLNEVDKAMEEFKLGNQYSGYQHQSSLNKDMGSLLAKKGLDAIINEDYVNASRLFEEAIQFKPEVPNARFLLATAYTGQGKYEKAIPLFRADVESNNKNPQVFTSYANCLLLAGRLDEAKVFGQNVLATSTDPKLKAFSQSFLGFVYLDQGKVDDAIAFWKNSRTTEPDNPEIIAGLGIAYFAKGNKKEAVTLIKEAAKTDSRFIDTKWLGSFKGARWSPHDVSLAEQLIKLIK